MRAVAQAAPRSWGCPIPGSAQGQAGWGLGFGQPGLMEGVPAHGRGWNWVVVKGPFQPKLFCDSNKF